MIQRDLFQNIPNEKWKILCKNVLEYEVRTNMFFHDDFAWMATYILLEIGLENPKTLDANDL